MDMTKMGPQNLAQGSKSWAAGHLGHPSTRVPYLRTKDCQRERQKAASFQSPRPLVSPS